MRLRRSRQRLVDTVRQLLLRVVVKRRGLIAVDADQRSLVRIVRLLAGFFLGRYGIDGDDDGACLAGIGGEDAADGHLMSAVRIDDFRLIADLQTRLFGGEGMKGDLIAVLRPRAGRELGGPPRRRLAHAYGERRRPHGGHRIAMLVEQHHAGQHVHDACRGNTVDLGYRARQIDADIVVAFRRSHRHRRRIFFLLLRTAHVHVMVRIGGHHL